MSYLLKSSTDADGNKTLVDSGLYADSGVLELRTEQGSSPSAPADGSGGKIYTKADGKLYWVSNEISEIEVSRELVYTNASSTNADHYLTFVASTAATQALNTQANIKYNPSTQTLSVTNLTVTGTTTTINSTVVSIADPILQLGANASDDNLDRGLVLLYNDGSARKAFMGYDDSDGKFSMLTAATDTSNVFTGTKATLKANLEGNATTATTIATARTIGGVSFDGSANINLPGVNAVGNQNTTGSAATLTTARTIGGVSFDGSANVDLPGVNAAGNQNTTGSAATLTTPRTIGGVSFDGSANINLPGVNTAGTQNTSGNAATATTAGTVTTAAQSAITSVGNLTALNINGAFSFPTSDGSANQVMKTDGSGTLSWAAASSGNGVVSGILAIDSEQSSTPAAPADGAGGKLYTKADGKPYWISNELSETDLSAAGGGGGSSVFTTSGSNIYWNGSGSVGIGTTSPAVKMDIRGHTNVGSSGAAANLTVYGNVQWTSDARYKHNVRDIKGALETVELLRPVTYHRTWDMRAPYSEIANPEGLQREAGLIAQEVEDIPELKNLVKQDAAGEPMTLNYTGVFSYLIKAVQELSQQNRELLERVEKLETSV